MAGGGVIITVPAARLASPEAIIRLWYVASATDHLITAFPSCPQWVSTAVDHLTVERDLLLQQEVA